ncbi:MAG: hypothetical protein AAF466_14675 [Bacteroidota bacterium]
MLDRYPDSPWILRALADARFHAKDAAGATHTIERVVARWPNSSDFDRLVGFRLRAKDRDGALHAALRGYLALNDAESTARQLQRVAGALRRVTDDGDDFVGWSDAAVASLDCRPDQRQRLQLLVDEAFADRRAEVEAVLADHLARIVAACRRHHAEPILLTYPQRWEAGIRLVEPG